jgi:hypothetical protein
MPPLKQATFMMVLLIAPGCSRGERDDRVKPSASSDAGAMPSKLGARPGALGGVCALDADCDPGLRCISPWGFPAATKYCAPTCSTPDDCAAFAATSYAISVPLESSGGENAWGLTTLWRGMVCDVSNEHGGAQKYCQFVCPDLSAIKANGQSCSCLPRHRSVTNDAGDFIHCEFSEESQCSIVEYPGRPNVCDACNSTPLISGCNTGIYTCVMNLNFNGDCYQWFDGGSIEACLAQQAYDCDPDCMMRCGGSTSSCTNLCCSETSRLASEAPECGEDGPGPSGTGGWGGAGGSGTGGTPTWGGAGGSETGGTSWGGAGGSETGGTSWGGAGGSGTGGSTSSGGGGGAGGGTIECSDPAYPVYCPATDEAAAGCWTLGTVCSTITVCTDRTTACTAEGYVPDCAKTGCYPSSSCVLEETDACSACIEAKCCGLLARAQEWNVCVDWEAVSDCSYQECACDLPPPPLCEGIIIN